MSKVIIRQTEIPKWNHAQIKEWYPGYTILGQKFGWFAAVDATKVVFVDYSWKEVVKAVTAHLRGNDLPVPADINMVLMEEYCETTGSVACGDEDLTSSARERFVASASRFLRAMDDVLLKGMIVSQEEAERRAAICAGCEFNKAEKYKFCIGCSSKTAAAKLAKMALGRSTSRDAELKTCQICECRLPLKVWAYRESMDDAAYRDKWPTNYPCWMREGQ